jgi:hypothetical protein
MTPISFKMNEAYLIPINSGSTVYNCVIDFYTINKNINSLTKPSNTHKIDLPDYFNLTIRTYKTYKEWSPFTVYKIGDKVIYYGRIYESQINNNKVKNPRKYENVKSWTSNSNYETTSTVEYNRDIFVFNGTTSSSNPIVATQSWLKITEWKEVDLEPVQTIKEFRQIEKEMDNPIPPFNFTIDSNIDPFIVIEVTSDNGYGLIYRDKKNYEVRGNKDLVEPINYVDLIGPFTPITPIY